MIRARINCPNPHLSGYELPFTRPGRRRVRVCLRLGVTLAYTRHWMEPWVLRRQHGRKPDGWRRVQNTGQGGIVRLKPFGKSKTGPKGMREWLRDQILDISLKSRFFNLKIECLENAESRKIFFTIRILVLYQPTMGSLVYFFPYAFFTLFNGCVLHMLCLPLILCA